MRNFKAACLAVICLFLVACKTAPPTYRYEASPADPTISFESDFELHTRFKVNTKLPYSNVCSYFDTVGYLLKVDSVFVYDRPNAEISIKVAENKPLAIFAQHQYDDPGYRANCGPLVQVFTPAGNSRYIVKLNRADKVCYMSVTAIDVLGKRTPVETQNMGRCY